MMRNEPDGPEEEVRDRAAALERPPGDERQGFTRRFLPVAALVTGGVAIFMALVGVFVDLS
jgi:hypothetical protein